MIELYYWPTPNGWKVSIMLEEVKLPYRVVPVNIGRGEQFAPAFLAISPNNRIPALVDPSPPGGGAPLAMFESGAILLYLAEKTGQLLPREPHARYDVLQWLMWQMGGLGPMLGQANHFRHYAPEPVPYGIHRYTKEAERLLGVLDRRLTEREYLAGGYSIADIACWPWVGALERVGRSWDEFPNVRRWYDAIAARPAVQRGRAVGEELARQPLDEEARRVLFGAKAPQ
jgi:GST-like protein